MDYSKMSDQDVTVEVAKALNLAWTRSSDSVVFVADDTAIGRHTFDPCNNASDAWPIITENNISIILDNPTMPCATANARDLFDDADPIVSVVYDKPLRAAMLVYLQLQEAK